MTPDTDRMTVPEVAAFLRCSEATARRLLGNEIPAVKRYRWTADRRDVQAWVDAHTETDRGTKQRRRGRGRRT